MWWSTWPWHWRFPKYHFFSFVLFPILNPKNHQSHHFRNLVLSGKKLIKFDFIIDLWTYLKSKCLSFSFSKNFPFHLILKCEFFKHLKQTKKIAMFIDFYVPPLFCFSFFLFCLVAVDDKLQIFLLLEATKRFSFQKNCFFLKKEKNNSSNNTRQRQCQWRIVIEKKIIFVDIIDILNKQQMLIIMMLKCWSSSSTTSYKNFSWTWSWRLSKDIVDDIKSNHYKYRQRKREIHKERNSRQMYLIFSFPPTTNKYVQW
mgnify:CR=1 FL=1